MAQQTNMTAVEWLAEKIYHEGLDDEFVKKAIEMEKKQIIKAFNDLNDDTSAEQYYNETYNK